MPPKKSTTTFRHQRQIRIIKGKYDIPSIFDEPPIRPENEGRSYRITGTVLGIPARIHYDDDCRYWIGTQQQGTAWKSL